MEGRIAICQLSFILLSANFVFIFLSQNSEHILWLCYRGYRQPVCSYLPVYTILLYNSAHSVEEIAKKKGITMAQVALIWTMSKEGVTAPIVGTTSLENLVQLIGKSMDQPTCNVPDQRCSCREYVFDGRGDQVSQRALQGDGRGPLDCEVCMYNRDLDV